MYKAAERRLAALVQQCRVVKQSQGDGGAFIVWFLPNKTSWWKVLNNLWGDIPIYPCVHAHLESKTATHSCLLQVQVLAALCSLHPRWLGCFYNLPNIAPACLQLPAAAAPYRHSSCRNI